jgi:predicted 3-demethylubiquinone-9 3-methyltransferase (glyoxalase superfamily)
MIADNSQNPTQKIALNLWFDHQAEEAARFYASLFEDSQVGDVSRYDKAMAEISGRPEGSAMTVAFTLAGQNFVGLNGGPEFQLNPSISLFVYCDSEAEVDNLFAGLATGGQILMPLQKYPFSEKYAWLQDRYGVSWQLYLGRRRGPKIAYSLLFVGKQCGHAEEAIQLYTSVFEDGRIEGISRYGRDAAPEIEGTVEHASFWLDGQEFMAMDSNREHNFAFNEALSFIVHCESQTEVDYFWNKLTAEGEEQPCGWLKDKFGVSWQIVPTVLADLLQGGDAVRVGRVMGSLLQMQKIDIAQLQQAYAE